MVEVTALFPMLALIFTKKLRPTIIGSLSWLMLFGMMNGVREQLLNEQIGVILLLGVFAPQLCPDVGTASLWFEF
jgi:hypothetical protein